jgi:hypothetical protein
MLSMMPKAQNNPSNTGVQGRSQLIFVVVSILTVCLAGCANYEELSRIPSPDRLVEALVVRVDGGATTGFSYRVYVVPTGGARQDADEVLLVDCVKNLRAEWRDARQLEIHFDEARIFRFINFWRSKEVQSLRYVVEVMLIHPPGRILGC